MNPHEAKTRIRGASFRWDHELDGVRRLVTAHLMQTPLRDHLARFGSLVGGGKMLRSRLILRVAAATGTPQTIASTAAAAVEMLHGASVVHDDILDGGLQRRGCPSVWVSDGTRVAVMLGDLLVGVSADLIQSVLPDRIPLMIKTLRAMCEAEAAQEFNRLDATVTEWESCLDIARGKTGSLFGFAAACAGGNDPILVGALERAGCMLGTAYQLADDLLDVSPVGLRTGKTLGTDAATGKLTAATARPGDGAAPADHVHELLDASESTLAAWPKVQSAWRAYRREDLEPIVQQFIHSTSGELVA